MSDNSTAAGCNSRLVTVLVQHAHDCSRYRGIRIVSTPGNNICIRNVPLSATAAKSKARPYTAYVSVLSLLSLPFCSCRTVTCRPTVCLPWTHDIWRANILTLCSTLAITIVSLSSVVFCGRGNHSVYRCHVHCDWLCSVVHYLRHLWQGRPSVLQPFVGLSACLFPEKIKKLRVGFAQV